jgi:hypothetical protein
MTSNTENRTIYLTINDELCLINETIHNLENEINRYIEESKNMWNNHISKFIKSSDCLIFDYIGINGYEKFMKLMTHQKTYRLMKISLRRLHQRKMVLINNR